MSSFPRTERREGLDLIRLLSIAAIVCFHLHEEMFYENPMQEEFVGTVVESVLNYSWAISISGFSIVALSSFLAGHVRSGLNFVLTPIFGALAAAVLYFEPFPDSRPFGWDIYHFWLVGIFPLLLLVRYMNRKSDWALLALGTALLMLPFWSFAPEGSSMLWAILLGQSLAEGSACVAWPLLPWVGLVYFGFATGRLTRDAAVRAYLCEGFAKKEIILWVCALTGALPFLGAYASTPIGPGFACHMYRQAPYVFFAHLVWIFFAFRIAYLEVVSGLLRRHLPLLSQLAWSRHFGASYLLQLVLVVVLSRFASSTLVWPPLLVGIWLAVLLAPELVFLLVKTVRRLQR